MERYLLGVALGASGSDDDRGSDRADLERERYIQRLIGALDDNGPRGFGKSFTGDAHQVGSDRRDRRLVDAVGAGLDHDLLARRHVAQDHPRPRHRGAAPIRNSAADRRALRRRGREAQRHRHQTERQTLRHDLRSLPAPPARAGRLASARYGRAIPMPVDQADQIGPRETRALCVGQAPNGGGRGATCGTVGRSPRPSVRTGSARRDERCAANTCAARAASTARPSPTIAEAAAI